MALLLLSSALTLSPAHAATALGSTPKLRLCHACSMPALPVTLPRLGMVLSYGTILSDSSLWYVVDLERAEATRIVARTDRVTRQLGLVTHTTRPLQSDDQSALTQLAYRIWGSKEALPSTLATDVVWNLWLLDGDDVRQESATGRPAGMAREVEQIMLRLIGPD